MVFSGIKIRFFVRYNAIIKPLKPRLSKFRTILTAGATWVAGTMTFRLSDPTLPRSTSRSQFRTANAGLF